MLFDINGGGATEAVQAKCAVSYNQLPLRRREEATGILSAGRQRDSSLRLRLHARLSWERVWISKPFGAQASCGGVFKRRGPAVGRRSAPAPVSGLSSTGGSVLCVLPRSSSALLVFRLVFVYAVLPSTPRAFMSLSFGFARTPRGCLSRPLVFRPLEAAVPVGWTRLISGRGKRRRSEWRKQGPCLTEERTEISGTRSGLVACWAEGMLLHAALDAWERPSGTVLKNGARNFKLLCGALVHCTNFMSHSVREYARG